MDETERNKRSEGMKRAWLRRKAGLLPKEPEVRKEENLNLLLPESNEYGWGTAV